MLSPWQPCCFRYCHLELVAPLLRIPSHAHQCLAYFVYNFVVTLVLEPVQQQCFNAALDKLRGDPRITVRLGPSITGGGGTWAKAE